MPGTALIISPLIASMKDQVDRLQINGIAATYINSSLSSVEQLRRLDKLARGDWSWSTSRRNDCAASLYDGSEQVENLVAGRRRGALHLAMGARLRPYYLRIEECGAP